MKKNLKSLMMLGAILLLIGAVLMVNQLTIAPYLYTIGALLFGYVQVFHGKYEGQSLVIRRLRRLQIFGAIMLVVTGIPMFTMHHNEWILAMAIAAIFELYTAWRIPIELKKEK
ncbi:MAG: hypothetical protein ACTTJK_09510 [Phocaeicola sp.]|uniref:hypothetical protein n=1 Tax=Phocaeicola TaxID=909656 RepID=UPI00234E8C73|nr:hypothetical protein [Phocaeicola oris]MCE2617015.1 hypothetical protein [Phocaeicola oris]